MLLYYNPNGSLHSFELAVDAPTLPGVSFILIDEIYANRDILGRIISVFPVPAERSLWQVSGGNLFRNGIQQTIAQDLDWQTLKTEYQAAVDRLQQIENAGAIPFTQAGFNQVVQAVKDVAKYERFILIYLRKTRQ